MGIINFFVRLLIPMSLCAGFYCMNFAFLKRRAKVATVSTVNNAVVKTTLPPASGTKFSRASQNVAITVLYTIIGYLIAMTAHEV